MGDREAVQQLYTERVGLYHFLFFRLLGYGRGLRAALERDLELRPGARVLDAGCGSGVLTRHIDALARARGIGDLTLHGFDLTPAMLERFQAWIEATGARHVEARQADVLRPEQLPADWTGYDWVVTSAMLEYLPRPELPAALAHLRSRLALGGRLLLVITRHNPMTALLIERWWYANAYAPAELRGLLEGAGFREVRRRGFPWPYRHLNLWGDVWLAAA